MMFFYICLSRRKFNDNDRKLKIDTIRPNILVNPFQMAVLAGFQPSYLTLVMMGGGPYVPPLRLSRGLKERRIFWVFCTNCLMEVK